MTQPAPPHVTAEPPAPLELITKRRAVIYLRVSSAGQVNKDFDPEGYSIPGQRDACHRRAELLGATVVAEYVEYGESATAMTHRGELRRLLDELPDVRPDYVIVYDVSRLARDEGDAMMLFREINGVGATRARQRTGARRL